MNIIHEAIRLIDEHSDFDEEIGICLASHNGYFYKSPTAFVVCNYDQQTGDLLVHFAVGELMELIELIKFEPVTISFERNKRVRTYNYQQFINKALKKA